jgi:ATP-dependent Lon protease
MAADPARSYPSEMPVLALHDTSVLPLTVQPLAIDRPISLEAVNRALGGDRLLFLVLQAYDKDDPEPGDLRTIGTIAAIRQMGRVPAGGVHVIVEGLTRARSTITTRTGAAIRATVAPFPDAAERTLEDDAYVRRLRDLMERAKSVSSGLVLPVGGIREKALAAARYGIREFVLPARNEPDLAELPPEVRDTMHFVPVSTIEEVLAVALPQVPVSAS